MPAAVDEMASTPASQGALDASSDKKRNKLGYHRTSVACGHGNQIVDGFAHTSYTVHCRRRKIRCLVAADDTQGRCENCIRLRKECQFFPVDQQPPVEKKSRPSSRIETPTTDRPVTTPIASSPTTNLGPDSVETFYPYQPIPLNTSGQDMTSFSVDSFSGNPMPGFAADRAMGPGNFPGHPSMDPGVPWDEFTTMSDPTMIAQMPTGKGQMMNMAPNAWNPGTIPSGLPSAPPMTGQTQQMNTHPTFTLQPDGSMWPMPSGPSRAMSYPGQEIGSSYPNQFPPQMPPDLKRRMTTPAQSVPTAAGSHGSQGPSPAMQAPPGPMSYPGQPGMGYASWQDMNALPGVGVVPYPMYTGDAIQQPPFTTSPPPMGHPGAPGRSSGS
ncbi:hypothetical protein N7510_005288 [Penicillium lagena]|uniref:uncharacterized protein n=1 Tax=Penicillium lagena TaxID=94218 RepID=UPI00253F709C|nr:uncharacterized protein N7510_005288 [Penicillium lagena]KAJ5612094.1 hypothetical protein N7510_005288 [Penicillium lagena]